MRLLIWQISLGLLLILLSLILYLVHYAVYEDIHYLCKLSMTSFAFLPISVLFVTLILNQLMGVRERKLRLGKLNMVAGAFFTEVGTKLLNQFAEIDANQDKIRADLIVNDDWSEQDFFNINKHVKRYRSGVDIEKVQLEDLRGYLLQKNNFLLRLLENPNLLEHESFAELLRAVFHLTDELAARKDLKNLPASDKQHLAIDINRAYISLIRRWLAYMKYLKNITPISSRLPRGPILLT